MNEGLTWKECQVAMANKALDLGLKFPTYRFTYGKIGARQPYEQNPMWGSVWVTNSDGIQIGRLIFKEGVFDHSKVYGAGKYPFETLLNSEIWASLEEEARKED